MGFSKSVTEVQQPDGAVSFDYATGQIRTLLGRFGAMGVRFHFDQPRPENPTELYAAAYSLSRDIISLDGLSNDDYFKSDGTTESASSAPDIITSSRVPKAGACVSFNRTTLEGYLENTNIVAVRLYVVGYGSDGENLSLVAAGVNSAGDAVGPFLLSEQPCPPNCPVGYP